MTNSVIAIEDATLRCYQAVGNVYESCWIHFSDITDVIFLSLIHISEPTRP